jgi:hypothetical protein
MYQSFIKIFLEFFSLRVLPAVLESILRTGFNGPISRFSCGLQTVGLESILVTGFNGPISRVSCELQTVGLEKILATGFNGPIQRVPSPQNWSYFNQKARARAFKKGLVLINFVKSMCFLALLKA